MFFARVSCMVHPNCPSTNLDLLLKHLQTCFFHNNMFGTFGTYIIFIFIFNTLEPTKPEPLERS